MHGDQPFNNPAVSAATFVEEFTQGGSTRGCVGLLD